MAEQLNRAELEASLKLWQSRVKIGRERLATAETDEQKLIAVNDIRCARREVGCFQARLD